MKVIEFQNYWGNNMDFELKSVKNFRDLGNIKTKDNKKIKENLLFRSASLDSLSEDEYLLLKNKCNLQLVIDFRSETSFINKPDKIFSTRKEHLKVYKYLDKQRFDYTIKVTPDEFFFNVYKGFTLTEESIETYSKFFRLIIDQKEGSIIFHCTSGKDRTGIAAILLLYVLGVDKETIIKEHMKTFNYMYPIFKKELDNIDNPTYFDVDFLYCLYIPKQIYVEFYFKLLDEHYGGIDNYIRNYLKISDEDIKVLRDRYLENI